MLIVSTVVVLLSQVCGRPVWVPGSIVAVRGVKPAHYAGMSLDDLRSVDVRSFDLERSVVGVRHVSLCP